MGQILVAIDTDVGLTGYGVGGGGAAGLHVVRTVLREVLLRQNPEPVEEHWQRMYAATLAFGRKGLAIMALSGVDLALWDLRGKAAKKPIADLLSDTVQRRVPTYTTVWDEIRPEQIGTAKAFKLHLGLEKTSSIVARVSQARKAIGPDAALMIDAWMKWSVPFTLEVAAAIRPFQVDWIEEPLSPDDLAGYEELRDRCPIPIAGGEHEFTRYGFRELIERRLHRVLQPDVCWCGGMTELVEIYRLGLAAGLRICPHRGAELWGLHAVAALDPEPLAESGRPWMTWVGGQPAIVDGMIELPNRPGFGAVIWEEALPGV